MHPNPAFRWEDRAAMRAFASEIGFGMLFAATPDGPRVAHIPFVFLDEDRIGFHVARGNGIARGLAGTEALFVVNGPDAYISPDWYGLPDQVPTWNYLTLEMQGVVTKMDRATLIAQADALSLQHETRLAPKPVWTRDKMAASSALNCVSPAGAARRNWGRINRPRRAPKSPMRWRRAGSGRWRC
jgi:transcriptional regulator